MDDQFVEEVKRRKAEGQSERQMATELGVSRSKVHNTLQDLKLSENSTALVPEDKLENDYSGGTGTGTQRRGRRG
jgi:hypothetical protein